jgi:esterase
MLLHSQILGEGTPFVILHGFMGMGDNWKTLGKKFTEEGYQIHLVDQRNHGRSFHDPVFTYEAMATDLLMYCEHHNLDEIVLLGHSMGGKTAMEFAVNYPERVSKLLVADIGPKAYPQHHQDVLKALSLLNFSVIKTRGSADIALAAYIKDPGTRLFLLKNLYWVVKGQLALRVNLPVVINEIEQVGKALDANAIFEKETLFLRGEHSGYITSLDEIGIQKQFPNCEIKTILNAGHWLHAENPVQFHQIVKNFL